MPLYVPLPTGATPELSYAAQVASLLPALNLGQPNGGQTWYTDFVGASKLLTFTSNGTVTFPGTQRGGVALVQSSAVAGGFAGVIAGDSARAVVQIANPRTESWAVMFRANLPALSANTRIWIGVEDSGHANRSGLHISGTGAGTGTLNLNANGTLSATSWPMELTSFHEFLVTYDTVTMTAYVDGVAVGSSANSATVMTQAASTCCFVFNNSAATNEQAKINRAFAAYGAP